MPAARIFSCICLALSASLNAATCTTKPPLPGADVDEACGAAALLAAGACVGFADVFGGAASVSCAGGTVSAGRAPEACATSVLGAGCGLRAVSGAAFGADFGPGVPGAIGTTFDVNVPDSEEGIWMLMSCLTCFGSWSRNIGRNTATMVTSAI